MVAQTENLKPLTNDDLRRLGNLRTSLAAAHPIGNRCGVYRLSHRKTGASYVGGSRNIAERAKMHRCNRSNDSQPLLRNAFAGKSTAEFDFEVLELCDPKVLFEREAHWIGVLGPSLNNVRPSTKQPTPRRSAVKTILGDGVPDSNLIRRFRAGAELPPVYVAPRNAFIREALKLARVEAKRAGYPKFFFQGMVYAVETIDVAPEAIQ